MTLNTIPHTSSNTRCHLSLSLRHFASNTNKPKLHESCSIKSKPYSMLQIKKNFLCCVVKEKFRHSFVLPKKYSVREINNSPKRYLSIYLSIYLYACVCVSFCVSIYLSIYLCVCVYVVCVCVYLSMYLYLDRFFYLSIYLSIYLSPIDPSLFI